MDPYFTMDNFYILLADRCDQFEDRGAIQVQGE
jgi:hypothetical protein